MPGFLASLIFHCIVQQKKPDVIFILFEILAFSTIIYILANIFIEWRPIVEISSATNKITWTTWDNYPSIAIVLLFSIVTPIPIGAFVFHDLHMRLLRKIHVTNNTSSATAWTDAFKNQKRFVVLHLCDGRRICGSPTYYSIGESGSYVYLQNPSWIVEDKYSDCGSHGILFNGKDVEMIEFLLELNGK